MPVCIPSNYCCRCKKKTDHHLLVKLSGSVKPKRCSGKGLSDGSYLATVRKKITIPARCGEKRNRCQSVVDITVRMIDYSDSGLSPGSAAHHDTGPDDKRQGIGEPLSSALGH
jgi:hypothetical protein